MNDDLHPDPTDTELLASALIDGALPADEAGSAQASPEVAALAEQFTAVRTVLADVPPAPIEARERALAAALAVFDELPAGYAAAAALPPRWHRSCASPIGAGGRHVCWPRPPR